MKLFELPHATLVLGGAASGKSTYAEGLVTGTGRDRVYIATAQAMDGEMQDKITRHKAQRGPDWHTVEAPYDLAKVLAQVDSRQVVLVDCLTLWLTNHLIAESDLNQQAASLCSALADCACPVVLVSNEVGQGIVPDNALSRRFRDAQGRLNRLVAAQAGLVVTVIAGLPLALKGQLPESGP